MTKRKSAETTNAPETDSGTMEITPDEACVAAAAAAQMELIDMLARLILEAIEHDIRRASPTKRSRSKRTLR